MVFRGDVLVIRSRKPHSRTVANRAVAQAIGKTLLAFTVGVSATVVSAPLAAASIPTTVPQLQPVDGESLADTNSGADAIAASATSSGLTERPDTWMQTSRTFTAANGINTTVIGLTPLNYQDAGATWQPIDDELTADTTTGYAWRNTADAYSVEFPANLLSGPIRVSNNGGWVAFQIAGATGAGVVSGNTITYANALPGVSLTYAATPLGLKETMTLADASALSAFTVVVTSSDGLTTATQVDGSTGFVNATGDLIASLAKPWITDANQDMSGLDDALSSSLTPDGTNAWLDALTVSATWLTAPSRSWPVTIDPTLKTEQDFSTDCLMFSGHPTSGVCAQNPAGVGYHADDSLIRRDVMEFSVSSIPSSATVTDSELELDEGLTAYGPVELQIYRNDQSFSAVNATWDDADAHTGTAWISTGRGGDPVGSALISTPFGCDPTGPSCAGVKTFNIAGATQNWVNGTWANTGILLREQVETNDGVVQFNGSNSPTGPPNIVVTWDRNPDQPTLVSPASGATGLSPSPSLQANVTDPDGGDLYARFFVRTHGSSTWDIANGVIMPAPNADDSNGVASGATVTYSPSLSPGVTYDWTAQTWDGTLFSTTPTAQSFTVAPLPPQPTVSSSTHPSPGTWYTARNATLNWSAGSGMTGYSYVLDQPGSGSTTCPSTTPDTTSEGTATTVSYANLADGIYCFHVRAQNISGWGPASNTFEIDIDGTTPGAPSAVTSTPAPNSNGWITSGNFTMNWSVPTQTQVSGIAGYSYVLDQPAIGNTCPPTIPDTTSEGAAASVSYTGKADGAWCFHVRAESGAGLWGPAAHYTVSIDATPLTAPQNLTSNPAPNATGWLTMNSPTMTWSAPASTSGVTGYSYGPLDHPASGSTTCPTTAPDTTSEGTATSVSYSNLADGISCFHVRAENAAGVWGDTAHYTLRIDSVAPTSPANLTTTPSADGLSHATRTIAASWSAGTDATSGVAGYYYTFDNVATRPANTPLSADTFTATTTATLSNSTDGVWYVHVRTIDAAGNLSGYANYGPVILNNVSPIINKTLNTAAANGYYGRGQYLQYTVTVTNPSTLAPSTITGFSDTLQPGQLLIGTDILLSRSDDGSTAARHCLRITGSEQCTISTDGTTITLPNFTLPAGVSLQLVYTTLATGVENGCMITSNTATAADAAGSATTNPVSATICDTGLGIEPWWSYVSTAVGPQSTAQVNVANGNLVVQATDSTPINAHGRLGYVIRRTYNSQDTTALTLPGSLGAGWQLNVGATDDLAGAGVTPTSLSVPTANSVAAPLGITLIDRDGTRHVFTYRSASVAITSPVDVTSLAGGSPIHQLVPVNPLLRPSSLSGSAAFAHVCVDATYQAPAGVHLALWRYVGTNGSTCSAALNDSNARILGFTTMRPDRLRSEFDAAGHLLDLVDGSGVDLRYAYGTTGELRSISEARDCTGAVGTATCRGVVVTYSSDQTNACPIPAGAASSECVIDPAGRRTIYAFDNAVPKHLVEVDNPDDNPSGTRDRFQYAYQGFGASCGAAAAGQLCTVVEPRFDPKTGAVISTTFGYTAQSPLGLPRVTSITDRRHVMTTLAYTGAPSTATTVDDNGERTSYLSIDSSGRVGEVDQGATTASPLSITRYTWDTAANPCTYVSGTVQGTHTAWARPDNNLCRVTRAHISGASDETTSFAYTPEGMLLTSRQVMSSGPDLYRTYAYATQYVRNGSATITATDSVSGSGDVAVGNRSSAIGDGGSVAGDSSVVYALTDLVASLSPRGNVAGATVANFRTDYTVADSTAAEPDVNPGGNACTARNSGSVCTVSAPYSGSSKSITQYDYDSFGQKVSATVPKLSYETPPSGQTYQYTYTYYADSSTDHETHKTSMGGWLEAVTDPAGHYVFFTYDAAGDRTRTWDRNATTASGDSLSAMEAAVATGSGPVGASVTLYANPFNSMPWRYLLLTEEPVGPLTTYAVDVDGNVTAITTNAGHTTTQTFDEAGNLLTRTTPAEPGHPTTNTYDAFGNLATTTSPNNVVTAYRYDALNRRVTTYTDRGSASSGTSNPGGGCFVTDTGANAVPEYAVNEVVCAARASYDEFGNMVSSTDGANHTTTYTYDTANRRVDTLTPRTDTVSYTTRTLYDADGDAIDTCPPRQFTDGGASTCSDTSPGVYSTHRSFSEADRLLTTTTYRARPTSVHGDPANTPATSTDTTTYTYDADGNRTSVADPNNHVTTDVYDFLDRKTSELTPRTSGVNKRTVYTYDANGNVLSTTASGLAPVNVGGTPLNVGSPYSASNPYPLPADVTTYSSITLTGGAWITVPANSAPAAISITVSSTLSICSTCGITLDGDGWAGGTPAASALTTDGFTVSGSGSGPGAGAGGTSAATAGGGGGGAGYSAAGTDGFGGGSPLGGAGGNAGSPYGDATIGGETSTQAGSGGGAGGTIEPSTLGGVGGAGGGILHVTANQIILDGSITARGANGADGQVVQGALGAGGGGGGSGGAIWLSAPQIITDSGSIGHVDVSGGAGGSGTPGGTDGSGGAGAPGRVRFDTDELSSSIVTTAGSTQRTTFGRTTAYSYDFDNRLVDTVIGASSPNAAADGPTGSDGGSNVRTRLVYDDEGNVVGRFDPRAFAASVTSPDVRYESVAVYDADHRLTDVYQPYSDSSGASDPNGAPSQCPDAASLGISAYQGLTGVHVCRLHYGYDHDGNRTLTQLPTYDSSDTTRVYTAAYTPDDLLASTSVPDPSVTSHAAALRAEAYTYDGAGRRLTDQELPDTGGPTTTTTYTADGLVATVTPPTGGASHLTTYGYDPNGAQVSVTMQQDASTTRTSFTDYNSDGSVYANVDPAGNTTSYTYDAAGNQIAVYGPSANAGDATNPNHLPTVYSYFDDNLLATTSTPTVSSGATRRLTTYGYNLGGDKTSVDVDYTNASGTVTTDGAPQRFGYYPDGRIESSTGRSGGSQAFSYDAAGHPLSSSDTANGDTVTTAATYYLDNAIRTVSESGTVVPTSSTTYSYDAAGSVDLRQSQVGTSTTSTSFAYTDNEQLANVAGGVTGTTITLVYDSQGRPTTTNYASGVALTRTWNADDTLASQSLATNGNSSNWAYAYDGMSRVTAADNTSGATSTDCTAATLPNGLQCFTYDAAGRLHSFADSQASRTATYDADGNRLSYGDAAHPSVAPVVTANYNPDDSIHDQKVGSGTDNVYVYALPFGGVTSDGCSTYAYDGFGRLSSVTGSGGSGCTSNVSYTYDALDRQVQRNETGSNAVRGGVTNLAYDGLAMTLTSESLPSSGGLTRYTLDGAGAAWAVTNSSTNGQTQYLADDGQGNVTNPVTASSGNLACGFRYDPWGSALTTSLSVTPTCTSGNTPTDLQYRGEAKDPTTGTYQLGSRTYDPAKTGFLNPDSYRNAPSSGDLSIGTDPLTRDSYNYVNGDPINLIDPSGHMNEAEGGGGCGNLRMRTCRLVEQYNYYLVEKELIRQHDAYYAAVGERKQCVEHRCGGVNDPSAAAAYSKSMLEILNGAAYQGDINSPWVKTLDPLVQSFWQQAKPSFEGVVTEDDTVQGIIDTIATLGIAAPEEAAVSAGETAAKEVTEQAVKAAARVTVDDAAPQAARDAVSMEEDLVASGRSFGPGAAHVDDPAFSPAFYRGAPPGENPSFTLKPGEYRVTGASQVRGLSVFNNPEAVASRGMVPFEVDQSTVSDALSIEQRGGNLEHFEIVPAGGAFPPQNEFQSLLDEIEVFGGGE